MQEEPVLLLAGVREPALVVLVPVLALALALVLVPVQVAELMLEPPPMPAWWTQTWATTTLVVKQAPLPTTP